MENEQAVISAVLQGDKEQFAQLIDRYKEGLYLHCYGIVRDEAAAEDLAQDSFVEAYFKLKKYDSSYRFSTWLYRIATNKSIDYLRRNRSLRIKDSELDKLSSGLPTPHSAAQDTELHELVSKLAPKYRSVLSLYYWQGQSYEEIAQVMRVPVGSVKGWLNRAKLMLREELV